MNQEKSQIQIYISQNMGRINSTNGLSSFQHVGFHTLIFRQLFMGSFFIINIIMRQCFFYEGTKIQTSLGHFILAQNKLDSHHYALERIENCPNNYVYESYSCFDDSHFLRYYTCWDEEQLVLKKVQKQELTQSKGTKKKSGGLASFLSKKKAEISEASSTKTETTTKSKKEIQAKKQETVKVRVVYIQLDAFQPIILPESIEERKNVLAIIYLMAQSVHKSQGIWPNMIPVMSGDGCFRFVKKGTTKDQQLVRLFEYAIKQSGVEQWSKQMIGAYEDYKLNGDSLTMADRIHSQLQEIYRKKYEITVKEEGKSTTQQIELVECDTLLVGEWKRKIRMPEYNIVVSYNGQNTKEITLEHYLEDEIVMIGECSHFVIRYLRAFRGK